MNSYGILLLMSLVQVTDYGLPTTSEPTPPSTLMSSFEIQCGSDTLVVANYGLARPRGRQPVIRLNGRTLTGQVAGRLRVDLSAQDTVYQLTGVCFQPGPSIQFQIYSARNTPGGVRYHVGRADFYRGRISYTGLEEVNAETFWFR